MIIIRVKNSSVGIWKTIVDKPIKAKCRSRTWCLQKLDEKKFVVSAQIRYTKSISSPDFRKETLTQIKKIILHKESVSGA